MSDDNGSNSDFFNSLEGQEVGSCLQNQNMCDVYLQKLHEFIHSLSARADHPICPQYLRHISAKKRNDLLEINFSKELMISYAKTRVKHIQKNKKTKNNWNMKDIRLLVWVVAKYCEMNHVALNQLSNEDWASISSIIPGLDPKTALFRWFSIERNTAPKKWSKREDQILRSLIRQHGDTDWPEISRLLFQTNQDANKVFRASKQCRQHWKWHLNPKNKSGPWTLQEDIALVTLVLEEKGQKKWSEFTKKIQGRTENALKNRYHLLIGKLIKGSPSKYSCELQVLKQFLLSHGLNDFGSDNNHEPVELRWSSWRHREKSMQLREKKRKQSEEEEDWMRHLKKTNYGIYRMIKSGTKQHDSRELSVKPAEAPDQNGGLEEDKEASINNELQEDDKADAKNEGQSIQIPPSFLSRNSFRNLSWVSNDRKEKLSDNEKFIHFSNYQL